MHLFSTPFAWFFTTQFFSCGPRWKILVEAKFAQVGIFSTLNLFAWEIILTKKLEIEKTKPSFSRVDKHSQLRKFHPECG